MAKILLLYATRSGSTGEVAEFIGGILRKRGIGVDIQMAEHFGEDIHDYDAVIISSPIYKGVWLKSLWRNVRRLEPQFKNKPVWGFSLCMRVLEVAGGDYAKAHYLPHHALDKLNLQDYRFFGGRLENLSISQKTEFFDAYDGTAGRREGDFRNWDAIRAWAVAIADQMGQDTVR